MFVKHWERVTNGYKWRFYFYFLHCSSSKFANGYYSNLQKLFLTSDNTYRRSLQLNKEHNKFLMFFIRNNTFFFFMFYLSIYTASKWVCLLPIFLLPVPFFLRNYFVQWIVRYLRNNYVYITCVKGTKINENPIWKLSPINYFYDESEY